MASQEFGVLETHRDDFSGCVDGGRITPLTAVMVTVIECDTSTSSGHHGAVQGRPACRQRGLFNCRNAQRDCTEIAGCKPQRTSPSPRKTTTPVQSRERTLTWLDRQHFCKFRQCTHPHTALSQCYTTAWLLFITQKKKMISQQRCKRIVIGF